MSFSPPQVWTQRPLAELVALNSWRSSVWVRAFVGFQFACQLALLSEFFNPLRVYVRGAAFGSSLLFLLLLPKGQGRAHPAIHAAGWVMVILILSLFHPTTNSLVAGTAQIGLYLAILGPLFWVPRLQLDVAALRRVLLIIFIFHTLSAGTGVLQAYFPGNLQPSLSAALAEKDKGYVQDLKITLTSGQRVFRPMGLTDVPGGAAAAGFYTVLLGMGFFVTSRRLDARLACLGSITLGLTCLYLSQVRLWLVITSICTLAFCGLLAWQKRTIKLVSLGSALVAVIALSFTLAVFLGGESVTKRMSTLINDQPTAVYYSNRGIFLEDTIRVLLPRYPLGAGLGRCGMMNAYFGDNSDPERANIYIEIQWTGWLLDGGIPLVLAYVAVLFLAFSIALIVALNQTVGELSIWAAIVLAYNIGALATTFSYTIFFAQSGMELWLLNAALFAAARTALPHLSSFKKPHR